MLRGIWQSFKDFIKDAVLGTERTQEEIDLLIEEELIQYAKKGVHYDYDFEPGYKQRKHTFYSHKDAIFYARNIPPAYVAINVLADYNEYGDVAYEVWVDETE